MPKASALPPKQARDSAIAAILATRFSVTEPCVFVNCSQSLPQVRAAYKGAVVPEVATRHALCQSWYGSSSVITETPPRETVFAHVNGAIEYVIYARNWTLVHGKRVIFDLNWLPRSHPYRALVGLNISSVIGSPHPIHSAFLFQ